MRWFRCYTEIRTDSKMHSLSDHEFRLWVHLLALVSEEGDGGNIRRHAGMSRALGTTPHKWSSASATFMSLGLIDMTPKDLTVRAWGKRQFVSDDPTPRVKRYRNGREPLPKREGNVTRNVTVTPPDNRLQITDPETDNRQQTPTAGRSARQLYEHVTGRAVGQQKALRDELDKLQGEHGADCMSWAFEQSIGTEKPWPYARKILASCKTEGHGPNRGPADDLDDDFAEATRRAQ